MDADALYVAEPMLKSNGSEEIREPGKEEDNPNLKTITGRLPSNLEMFERYVEPDEWFDYWNEVRQIKYGYG